MRFSRYAAVAVAMLVLPISGTRPSSAEQPPEQAFAELEKWLIGTYLESTEDESGRGRGRGKSEKGKDRGRGKAPSLPIAEGEGVAPNSVLPPGVDVSDLPRELESRLPPLPEGLVRVLVADRVALVEKESRRIQDLFDPQDAREKGPPRELAVCHVPPGNPSKRRTRILPEPAIRSHLDHGDYIGRCR